MKLLFIFIFFPLILCAQNDTTKSVFFEQGLSWDQIKAKAKAENKYIFIDCFTTWCGPCKKMDQLVFTDDTVGQVANRYFISLKMQFDTSKNDNDYIKKWYNEAHKFLTKYEITSFPTFLFFSPEGDIVHRDIGYRSSSEFIKLLNTANDPHKQLYTLLNQYEKGEKNYSDLPYLANTTKTILKNRALAIKIGQDYLKNYLYKLPADKLYTKENIDFIASYVQTSTEKGFEMFFNESKKIDELKRPGYSQNMVDYLITLDDINKKIYNIKGEAITKNPKWNKIKSELIKKFGLPYADRNILNAQIRWYQQNKNWPQAIHYNIAKVHKYGLDTVGINAGHVNDMIWDVIFLHCTDNKILNEAIVWIQAIIRNNPGLGPLYDTYANLLYKSGRVVEAITNEEIALKMAKDVAIKYKVPIDESLEKNLAKMRSGQPTW